MEEVIIRAAQPEDLNFVLSTWLRSYRQNSKYTRFIRNSVFYPWHEKIIKTILQRPKTRTLVAALKEDPLIILGYLVVEGDTMHFAYVKSPFRQTGVFKTLCAQAYIALRITDPAERINYTHHTDDMTWLIRKYPAFNYHPYLI